MFNKKLRCWTGKVIIDVTSLGIFKESSNILVNGKTITDVHHIFEKTPFKDINGHDIYEGDIVSVRVKDNIYGNRDEIENRIVFKEDSTYNISSESSGGPDGIIEILDITLVGNYFSDTKALENTPQYAINQFKDFLKGEYEHNQRS